jgi:hypothetical protein
MKFSQKSLYIIAFSLAAVFVFLLCCAYFFSMKREYVQNAQQPVDITQKEWKPPKCELSEDVVSKMKGLDIETCRQISYFFVDKHSVYKQLFDPGSSETDQYIKIDKADAATFSQLGFSYYRDKNYLYHDAGMSVEEVSGVDLNSVKIISSHYIKDSQNVYFFGYENKIQPKVVLGFDAPTFELVRNQQTIDQEVYFRDKNGVYFFGGTKFLELEKLVSADSSTFEVLDYFLLAKDKNYIFYNGNIVTQANPASFRSIGAGYFKDNTHVFHTINNIIQAFQGVDVHSFELVGYGIGEYPTQYDVNWTGYSKDKNHVYYQGMVVEDADPATFQVQGTAAFDKNYEFNGVYKSDKM